MRGYAALARIDGSAVHVVRAIPPAPGLLELPIAEPPAGRRPLPLPARLAAVGEVLREQWAMTTFYLFDAESWR